MSPLAAAVVAGLVVASAGAGPAVVAREATAWRTRQRIGARATGPGRALLAAVGQGLADAGVEWPPGQAVRVWSVASATLVAGSWLAGGVVAAGSAVVVMAGAPVAARRASRNRAARLSDGQLPAALDAVARSLRSGASVHVAVADAAGHVGPPVGRELARMAAEVRAGLSLGEALEGWVERSPRSPVRLAAAVLALAAEAGGPGARAVDGVAASVRAEQAVAAEVRALASQARASAVVIALAPLGFLVLATGVDPRTAGFLLHEPLGRVCLLGGLALDGLGGWWMQRIVGRP